MHCYILKVISLKGKWLMSSRCTDLLLELINGDHHIQGGTDHNLSSYKHIYVSSRFIAFFMEI